MCGRYTIILTEEEFSILTGFADLPFTWQPRYNIAPGQLVPAIIASDGERRIGQLKWGLIPHWAKNEKRPWINARAETVAEKPSFRQSFQRRRCLIPADGFYEWKKTSTGTKQPMRIHLPERRLFMMAGLYDTWVRPDGSKLHTCTIVTTAANRFMSSIHDRMPVILPANAEQLWLEPGTGGAKTLQALLQPYPDEEMDAYPVSSRVGNVKYEEPSLIEKVPPVPDEGYLF